MYRGRGSIALGGGDELWLAINNTIVLEILTDPTHTLTTCKRIHIDNVNGEGERQ
jgi:hypothetical protein